MYPWKSATIKEVTRSHLDHSGVGLLDVGGGVKLEGGEELDSLVDDGGHGLGGGLRVVCRQLVGEQESIDDDGHLVYWAVLRRILEVVVDLG